MDECFYVTIKDEEKLKRKSDCGSRGRGGKNTSRGRCSFGKGYSNRNDAS